MKLSISTAELLSHLQSVSRVSSTRAALQALSGVRITAASGRCELAATDMEVGLRVSAPATVQVEGSVVLPSRLLLEVVRSLQVGDVSLELLSSDGVVEIVCGTANFRLRTLRSEDLPALPEPSPEGCITLPAAALTAAVETVARAASRDDTRPVLTGILVSASGRELSMVATDSYRLSVKRAALESEVPAPFEANVPARALQELARLAYAAASGSGDEDGGAEITVSLRDSQVIFEVGDAVLSSRLIDGQFPNYRQLLPDSADHQLTISTAELAGVVRRMSLLAQKSSPLRLSFVEGQLTVTAETAEVGSATEVIPVPFHGEAFEIGFNPEFLRDGLESVGSDEMVLKLISPLRPGLIESPEGGGFIYLIMPIRLT